MQSSASSYCRPSLQSPFHTRRFPSNGPWFSLEGFMCERVLVLIFLEIRTGNFTPLDLVTLLGTSCCVWKRKYSLYLYSSVLDISISFFFFFLNSTFNKVWADAKTGKKFDFILRCQCDILLPSTGYAPPVWLHCEQVRDGKVQEWARMCE